MSRNDRHLAVKLRKEGQSYKQISRELNIPKSTLSEWLGNLAWSKKIKGRLFEKARVQSRKKIKLVIAAQKLHWTNLRQQYKKEAINEFQTLKDNKLFLAGLMLYWSEGDNKEKSSMVRLGNTDPRMIKLFIHFALTICKVEKNRVRPTLILYPDIDEIRCKNFWSNFIKIPQEQFYKTQYIQGRHPSKRLENGICTVMVGNMALKTKILTWVDLWAEELMRV
jgi:hypothetical protein